MEWENPGIVLDARLYGEGDVIATVFTEAQGAFRGLVRGGGSRQRAATWQAGNLVQARWVARLAEQLGSFTGELVHASAALVMSDPLRLGTLAAACAVAEGALPEREPHPRVFQDLLHLLAHIARSAEPVADLVRWEALLLADLGYGLDLTACAVTGERDALAFVSPKTGRAVSENGAGEWRARLLALPGFLLGEAASSPEAWRDGLRLTGHFLARDAFGAQHRPLPAMRVALYDRVTAMTMTKDAADA